jgi:hypothetical protein
VVGVNAYTEKRALAAGGGQESILTVDDSVEPSRSSG